jgi:uridine kinase
MAVTLPSAPSSGARLVAVDPIDVDPIDVDPLDVVTMIMRRPGPTRLVAIDGPGGAGKSTFATRLAEAAVGAPVIHTDDFASADNPIDWWPRLLAEVVEPLVSGASAHFRRYDWSTRSLAEWITVDPAPIVIIEGVSSGRSEWARHLSFVVWVETPRQVRLARGLERDGADAIGDWEGWMDGEDSFYARDPVRARADLVIDGTA